MALSKAQKKAVLKAHLTPGMKKKIVSMHKMSGSGMQGAGFMDFIKKVGNFIGPIAKVVGPVVLKEVVVPLLKSKVGLGLTPTGGGLRLAGSGHCMGMSKPKKVKRKVKKKKA
jgi:hypothetical protein